MALPTCLKSVGSDAGREPHLPARLSCEHLYESLREMTSSPSGLRLGSLTLVAAVDLAAATRETVRHSRD
jgi:hypothetical protein